MQKGKKNIDNEHLANQYLNSYVLLLNNETVNIDMYNKIHKKIREELIFMEDNEPLKIFNKAHKQWKEYKNHLFNLYQKINLELRQEYKEFEEIMNLIPHQN